MSAKPNQLQARFLLFFGWCLSGILLLTAPCHGQTLYQFGNPTSDEQLYIEFINRARANPTAEGVRLANTTDPDVLVAMNFFSVNRTMMQSEFAAIPAAPPLAPNANLTTAARGHSLWMLNTATQSHNQGTANTPASRITAAGYSWATIGENIYAYSKNTWFGHAGFQVDWGTGGTGGMQAGRGHRVAIHNAAFREVGVGVLHGTNGAVGPQLVTQDFGRQSSNPTFATGVAYYDLNGNNFYDQNEGISGLTVNVSGASHFCNTAIGGGWAVPVPSTAATRTVTFSGLNVNHTSNLTLAANTNAKLDLRMTYSPPSITSQATAVAGSPHQLAFTSVGGAATYEWNTWGMTNAAPENCNSASTITSSTTGTYSVLNTAVRQEGTGSFKLENSTGANQWFQLNSLYYGGSSPSISFQSSIRFAAIAESFKVQVREEGSTAWVDVFSQNGTNGAGSTAFTLRTANLTGMAGKAFRIRFLLNSSGSYYAFSGNLYGWFVDAIQFSGVSSLQGNIRQTLNTNNGSFTPGAGTFLMAVAPVISDRPFTPAYQTLVVAPATQPSITTQPVSVTINRDSSAVFSVVATGSALAYQWFQGASGVTSQPVPLATSSSYTTPGLGADASYWVRVSNVAGSVNSTTATATVVIPPAIIDQPASTQILRGQSATLAVETTGTAPSLQWFQGSSGDTTKPVSGATSPQLVTPILTENAAYWVRAANAAGVAASDAAVVTVTDAFTNWARNLEISNGLPEGTISNATGDADHDGRSNLVEYAFGTSPVTANEPAPRMPVPETTETHFILRYQRDTALSGVRITPEACPGLGDWKEPGAMEGFTDILISTDGTIETREARLPLTSGGNCFMRMKVSQP